MGDLSTTPEDRIENNGSQLALSHWPVANSHCCSVSSLVLAQHVTGSAEDADFANKPFYQFYVL